MLYSLRGTLIHMEAGFAVIECGGVGYKCLTTLNTQRSLPKLHAEATLYTQLNVREDAVELFGFASQGELSCFKMLTAISGVGQRPGLRYCRSSLRSRWQCALRRTTAKR